MACVEASSSSASSQPSPAVGRASSRPRSATAIASSYRPHATSAMVAVAIASSITRCGTCGSARTGSSTSRTSGQRPACSRNRPRMASSPARCAVPATCAAAWSSTVPACSGWLRPQYRLSARIPAISVRSASVRADANWPDRRSSAGAALPWPTSACASSRSAVPVGSRFPGRPAELLGELVVERRQRPPGRGHQQ